MITEQEREIKGPVALCSDGGRLNRDAVGWSRHPLHDCSIAGRWPRKKRWNYWAVTCDRFMFSATVSDVDYIGLVFAYFIDFETGEHFEKTVPVPLGAGCRMGSMVGDDSSYNGPGLSVSHIHNSSGLTITASSGTFSGMKLRAEISVVRPPDHETLNVVVPWDDKTFQFTSKQNTLPAEGAVRIGDRKYEFERGRSFTCLDFGRGVWPYRTKWNWASFSHRQGDDVIGLNLGGIWTDGTGSTENGICLNGRLYKISEQAAITYNTSNFMAPWKLETPESGDVDLQLDPFYDKITGINLFVIATGCHQCFGRFNGTVRAGGRTIEIRNAIGWAEESVSKW